MDRDLNIQSSNFDFPSVGRRIEGVSGAENMDLILEGRIGAGLVNRSVQFDRGYRWGFGCIAIWGSEPSGPRPGGFRGSRRSNRGPNSDQGEGSWSEVGFVVRGRVREWVV